jgi:hypothetical protein
MEKLNLNADLFVPFHQIVFVSGKTVNQEHALPVALFDLVFHQLYDDFSWDQLAQSHRFFNQFFVPAVFFHFFS